MEQSRESKIEEYKREKQEAALVPQRIEGPIGGLTSFNIEYGFVEGLLRGFRSGFLKVRARGRRATARLFISPCARICSHSSTSSWRSAATSKT
jgi:hypothetical protein